MRAITGSGIGKYSRREKPVPSCIAVILTLDRPDRRAFVELEDGGHPWESRVFSERLSRENVDTIFMQGNPFRVGRTRSE
jgi:hypothetical protein